MCQQKMEMETMWWEGDETAMAGLWQGEGDGNKVGMGKILWEWGGDVDENFTMSFSSC